MVIERNRCKQIQELIALTHHQNKFPYSQPGSKMIKKQIRPD